MANTIRLKRASGSDPSASDLVTGELAVRTDTAKLFTKKDDNSVAEIGAGLTDGDKGDITVSSSGSVFTIDNDAVTNAKIADDAIEAAQLDNNCVTAAAIAANAVGSSELADDAVDTAAIADDAVTYAKIQNVSATDRLLGRDSSGAGVIEEIAPSAVRTMLGLATSATTDTTNADNIGSGTLNTARLPTTITHAAGVVVQATGSGNDVKLDAADHILLEAGEEEDGSIYFRGNSGVDSYRFAKGGQHTIEGFLSFESLTSDRTFTFPDSSGTLVAEDVEMSSGLVFGSTATCEAAIQALTDGSTITINFASGIHYSVTLGGNRTLGNPNNITSSLGQSGSIFITQDGTGGRTLAFHADYKFVGGTAPTLSTAAGAVDRIDYILKEANTVHCAVSLDVK